MPPSPAPRPSLGRPPSRALLSCAMTTRCTGKKPIIVAGEGKTGTETLASALAMLGLKTIHWESLLQCCELQTKPYPSCTTHAVGVTKPCNGISWSNSVPYVRLREKLTALETKDYDTFDFCVFDDFQVYSDVPMPSFAPYIYAAYGRGTKIIVTERDATEWSAVRSRFVFPTLPHSLTSPIPLRTAQDHPDGYAASSAETDEMGRH